MDVPEHEELLKSFAEAQAMEKHWRLQRERIGKTIKTMLPPGEHTAGSVGFKIVKREIARLDRDRLKAALGERFNDYVTLTPSWIVKTDVYTGRGE